MSDIRDWLRSNQLEQYAGVFEANDVDLDILRELSDGDLEKLGVSLGNRRRLLRAVAASDPEGPQPRSSGQNGPGPAEAERRQVTVLFADMVGSTALSAKLDPEVLASVIRHYQDAAAGAIGRYGGLVAKFMGDGVLAYFGFPQAFEDAAERAVRAAISLLAETSSIELPDQTGIQARVGIATGLVVVGEIIGTGIAQERTIVGETPNLAARLQALAEANTILVSDATQNLLGGLFELESTGEHELKGFARPVHAWRVRCEASIESRFAAIHAGRSLPLIGRSHEMGMIRERWNLARHGDGQIVTVIGEAGIGKSRSVEALMEALAAEPHARIHLQCSPHHSDSALHPVIQYLGRVAGLATSDSSAVRLDKLKARFARRMASNPTTLSLLAELLSIPLPEAAAPPSLQTPAQRKASTLGLIADEFLQAADGNPVLIVLEDAQWIDATTLELMTRLTDRIGRARALVLVTARPDFSPPWLARPHATLLTLSRLGRQDCIQLVNGVAAAHGLSAETIAAIIAKTDGVPLFIEELTRSVMESAGDKDTVPATLKDSLMARLDRLGEARDVAQVAAVIGRQFTLALLSSVTGKDIGVLDAALGRLVAAGVVFPEAGGVEHGFTFKHALVRDAAYESLLLTRRREWHGHIARALEEHFADVVAGEPGLLAYHFGEAGLWQPACEYHRRAGDQAASHSAYLEAIAHFSAGLKLAEMMPAQEGMPLQLQFLLKLAAALVVAHGFHSMEAESAYLRAGEIGEKLRDSGAAFQAKWGLWLNANIRRKTALARARAEELVALAQGSADEELLLEAHHCRWSTAFFGGDVKGALDDSRIGIELYDMARHRHLGHAFGGHDPGVCAHAQCANALQLLGNKELADQSLAQAVKLAEALGHPNSVAHALHNGSIGLQVSGDRNATFEMARRAVEMSERFGLLPWRAGSLVLVAWATAVGAGVAEGARLIDAEIGNATAVGPLPQYYVGLAAEVLLSAGRPADGLAHLDRAIAGIDEPGIGFYLPEIYRLRGKCLLALDRGNKQEAREAFAEARGIAERQNAVIFERRAEAALAELGDQAGA